MCGRFAMNGDVNEAINDWIAEGNSFADWSVAKWLDWQPSWNIKPTQQIPILFESAKDGEDVAQRLETAYWSLIPSWSKTLKLKYPTFNARAEGVTEKPTWKGPLKAHRSIVLSNGYFEWQTAADGKTKTPYFIHDPDASVIGFAGLYSWWPDPTKAAADENRWTLTATILTSDAVQTLADIHDRNPVILPRHMWAPWIDASVSGDQGLVDEAVAAGIAEASRLVFDQVAPVRGDGPHLVESVN